MQQRQAIEQRISRRSFLQSPIEQQILQQMKEAIEEVNEKSGLTISYLEDGSDAFAGFKSYGMFDGVRAMLVLKGNRELAFLKEKVGYYGEQLILKATELGLGSLWICMFDPEIVRKEFALPENIVPVNILVLGYADCEPASPDRHDTARKALEETVRFC